MKDESNIFFEELGVDPNSIPDHETKYLKIGLTFNPFPKSGTTNIRSSTEVLKHLKPVDEGVKREIANYLFSTLFSKTGDSKDKFMGATIIGNYGSGKTQLLMYVKYLLELASLNKEHNVKPYVIYISNPKLKLSELIGSIVSEVGEENFRKLLWNKVIKGLEEKFKSNLESEFSLAGSLFGEDGSPWNQKNRINYKIFIDAWLKNLSGNKNKLKLFQARIELYVVEILNSFIKDSSVSGYFYKILIDDLGFNSAWEGIIKGESKPLASKEVNIIRSIISLLYEEGYTHVYVLVDEFEDITRGRLKKDQVDNYLYSLRTLIDHERNWTIMFAMTEEAFAQLEKFNPALGDRISRKKILIHDLRQEETKKIIVNYLNMAREESTDEAFPFDDDAISYLSNPKIFNGNPRAILSNCFKLIEYAADNKINTITKEIVEEIS